MSVAIRRPGAHNPFELHLGGEPAVLDVLAFEGEEALSEPFKYRIEFTCAEPDFASERLLRRHASFFIHPAAKSASPAPLRTLHGVVTGFKRLSDSPEEARYELILESRLALLDNGQQYRLYQQQSVPEIVESILRTRHGFLGEDFLFDLARAYPRRAQVMQYGESDLAFISRLLAQVGIWYRIVNDERLQIPVVQFHDAQRFYRFGLELPHRPPGGLATDTDSVWGLQTEHRVVEKAVTVRAYDHRNILARLDGTVDKSGGATTTYGEAYLYAEPFTVMGDAHAWDLDIASESGEFFARLSHERRLNTATRLSGLSSHAALGPAQVLTVEGDAPEAFAPRCVMTRTQLSAARSESLVVRFDAMPYSETLCFRPPLRPKPVIAGTLPARVTTSKEDPLYGYLDLEGRYRVNFLFDRDSWKRGRESMYLRLARPYAGATHGLHLPLLPGTEVAIAFEQGDPDRPYIAHALHDNKHPDLVTFGNHQRNVLRTPANNKLRMDDARGQEHIKLSTDHSGKSQLNLGHIVDAERQPRGAGFELRTDGHGALRAGAGLFLSADKQPQAQGDVLDMSAAIAQFKDSLSTIRLLAGNARVAGGLEADETVLEELMRSLTDLSQAGLLASAPAGIALATPKHLQLSAGETLSTASDNADHSVLKRFTVTAGKAIGLFAQRLGLKLIANQGAVTVQAQNDSLEVLARTGLDIGCTDGEIRITAKKKIVLNAGSNYITLDPFRIEIGSPGEVEIKAPYFQHTPTAARHNGVMPPMAAPLKETPNRLLLDVADAWNTPIAGAPYRINFAGGLVLRGTLDDNGHAEHSPVPEERASVVYEFPEPQDDPVQSETALIDLIEADHSEHAPLAGPGKWVTHKVDYHGARTLGQLLLNRLISLGEEGRVYGSDGKDFEHTQRTVHQTWCELEAGQPPPSSGSAHRIYGETRAIEQTYLEGPDNWAVSGKSWHWQPVVADSTLEGEGAQP